MIDLNADGTPFKLNEYGFDLAFGMVYPIDDTIAKVSIQRMNKTNTVLPNGTVLEEYHPVALKTENCSVSKYNFTDKADVQ
jgi:hypothetical protein